MNTKNRTKVATSHEGKYSYWLDRDQYVYQYNHELEQWQGYLCSLAAWERSFFVAGHRIYSEYSAAQEAGIRLQSQGWRIQIHPIGRDDRGLATGWQMNGWAPDREALDASRFTPHYVAA